MSQETAKRIDLRAYWRIVWRRKKIVLLPIVVVVGTTIVGSYFLSPIYRSSATILVEDTRPLVRSLERILPDETRYSTRTLHASTLAAKIKNPALLQKVIDTLGLKPDSSAFVSILNHASGDTSEAKNMVNEWLIASLTKSISVRNKAPNVFEISLEWKDPDRVYEMAQKVTDFFIQDALEIQLEEVRSMYDFSVNQLAFYEKKLKESEEKLRRFKQAMARGMIEETPVDSSNIDDVNILLSDFSKENETLIEEVDSYYSKIAHLTNRFIPTEHLRVLKSKLISLSNDLSSLLVRYEWTAPAVLTTNSRINSVKDEIRSEVERIVEQRLPSASQESKKLLIEYELSRIDAESLKTIINRLRELIRKYEQKVVAAPTQELGLARLEQEVESNRQIYIMLLEQSKAANLSEALEYVKVETRYRIIEPPKKPLYPVKPEKVKIASVALIIGIIMGLGLAFLSEYMDHSLKTVEDVQEYIELPVLGTIPKIVSGGKKWKR